MKTHNKTRLKALLIDIAVVVILWIVLHMAAPPFLKGQIQYVFYHNLDIAIAIAAFLCKDLIGGKSIGKRFCRLKVVGDNGEDLSQTQLFLRNIFVFIAFIEVIFLFFSNKRTGDIALKSRVIYSEKKEKTTLKEWAVFSAYFILSILIYFIIVYLWWKIVKY